MHSQPVGTRQQEWGADSILSHPVVVAGDVLMMMTHSKGMGCNVVQPKEGAFQKGIVMLSEEVIR